VTSGRDAKTIASTASHLFQSGAGARLFSNRAQIGLPINTGKHGAPLYHAAGTVLTRVSGFIRHFGFVIHPPI